MARFESLKPEPDLGPYDIVVDGERVERVNPNNGDSEIVLQTTTTTEQKYVERRHSFRSEDYTGGYGTEYDPKSFGSAEEQWHKELRNIEVSVSAISGTSETAFCRVNLQFSDRRDETVDVTASKDWQDRSYGSDDKTVTIDSGTLTKVEVDGSHKYCDYCTDYQNSSADIIADVPVDETVADITAADTR